MISLYDAIMPWIFLIPPAFAIAHLAWCLKRGKICFHSTWYYREKNPKSFWTTIALYVFLVLAMFVPFVGTQWPKVFGCDPQHMRETGRCLRHPAH
jgi:hypothetical protein